MTVKELKLKYKEWEQKELERKFKELPKIKPPVGKQLSRKNI